MAKIKKKLKATTAPVVVPAAPVADDGVVRLLSKKQVLDRVGLSYVSIWMMMRDGRFPRSRTLTGGIRICWLESEVNQWMRNRPVTPLKGDDAAA